MKTNELIHVLSGFLYAYLPDVKGVSTNTIKSYQYAFQLLFEFMNEVKGIPPEKVTFSSLTNGVVPEYLAWLESMRGCSAMTGNHRRTAVASFAKYAVKKAFKEALAFYSEVTDIPRKKTPKGKDIRYFSKEEIACLLNLPDTTKTIGRRDAVLLSVLYSSGARAQELCDLTLNDITFGATTTLRLAGKGNKARRVAIPENCALLLKKYLKSRQLDISNVNERKKHVFSSQAHEKMTISCIEEIVKKYVVKAKTVYPALFKRKSYSPHCFRHSIAVHMLECGESIVVIKAFLGHASIETTTAYAEVTPELANKYLRERGKPVDSVKLEENRSSTLLPFLKNISSSD
jgi:site-specific recombinase XerD